MRKHRPYLTIYFVMLVIGFAVASVGCDDQGQPTDNLLTNPGSMKYAANSVKAFYTARDISDQATPIRELLDANSDNPTQDVDVQDPTPVTPGMWFHEKIPEHTKQFWMVHDGTSTAYRDGSGVIWYHVVSGPWASYYSPDPAGPAPGEDFHDVRGPTVTTWTEMWHISWGPDQSRYFDPAGGGSVWEHIPTGTDASRYKPIGSNHIATGPNASLYEVPADTVITGTLN